ncbi:hypothetical protein IV203_027552 [Nitzschia inconspicua]|uniref:Uncharacterized protein n=1 Tax=Nitzschia inconspicua TaxID=303405 RepID=A0A9K3Q3T8_9STRA|nr:hypothetical protein IV203_027552 [Nitzschia inconspicua]
MVRWTKSDDAKLIELWRTARNGVDPTKLDTPSVKAVHSKYFPEKKYENFAPLYRNKARSFQVARTLDGHRKRSSDAKAKQVDQVEIDLSKSDEDESSGEEEEAEQEESELENSFEETTDDMPPTPIRNRTPAKKSSTPAGESTIGVADITSSMKKMNVDPFCPHNFNATFPFIISSYGEGDDEMCDIFFFVPTLPRECFKPDVINNGIAFTLSMRVPRFFFKGKRILLANHENPNFNENTAAAQAFKKLCGRIETGNVDIQSIYTKPQIVQLPFVCEERIVEFEIQIARNNLGNLTDLCGGVQFHVVLWAKLRKIREKTRIVGKYRMIHDDSSDDDDMDL